SSVLGVDFGLAGAMTVFGSEALFAGFDAQEKRGLWITDGTSAGTSEITVTGSFDNGDVFGLGFASLPGFAVLGNKALFVGADASMNFALWVTDGTSAGTSELSVSVPSGLNPASPVAFGSEVLFSGRDVNNPHGGFGLWVTDGTVAGTSELNVAGVGTNGLFGNFSGAGFVVFGSEVLFGGIDTANKAGLWVTDGTAAGTSEISVAGAAASGLHPENLFVYGSEVLFNGFDASNRNELWATDGTS